jgi:hypothetical protein
VLYRFKSAYLGWGLKAAIEQRTGDQRPADGRVEQHFA